MPDRIDPDYDPAENEAARVLAALSRRIGSVHFRDSNGKGGWRDWLLAVAVLLAASGIAGVIVMYGDERDLSRAVTDLTKETDELKGDVKELNQILRSRP